jgi:hypothetical protein
MAAMGGESGGSAGEVLAQDAVGEVGARDLGGDLPLLARPKTTLSMRHMPSFTPVSMVLRRPADLPSRMRFWIAVLLTRISQASTSGVVQPRQQALADDAAQRLRPRWRGSASAATAGRRRAGG